MVENIIQKGIPGLGKDKQVGGRRGKREVASGMGATVALPPLTPTQQSYVDEEDARVEAAANAEKAAKAAKSSKDLGDFLARMANNTPGFMDYSDSERARQLRGKD